MGLFEEFTGKSTNNLKMGKGFLKNICCFNNKQYVKKNNEDDLEVYINFITKIIFNLLLVFIFSFCIFLCIFGFNETEENLWISTYESIKSSNQIFSTVFIDYERTNPFNYFQKEFENFVLFFTYFNMNKINFESLFLFLCIFSFILVLINYLLSNKNKEVVNFMNIFYIIFVDVFFSSIFFNLNNGKEGLVFFIRLIYFFILNTIIFIIYNLDTTVKEIFWIFLYKLTLLLIFIFTCSNNINSNKFLFEIGYFILVFIFLSIYISVRMDFRVRSTEFYLIQKNQNEYYQKLINLINKSFLCLNVTLFKITYNEAFLNFLKLIGLDENDINENINYSRNSEQRSFQKKSNVTPRFESNNYNQTNFGGIYQSNKNAIDDLYNENVLLRSNTKGLINKENNSNSNFNVELKENISNISQNNIPNNSSYEDRNVENDNNNIKINNEEAAKNNKNFNMKEKDKFQLNDLSIKNNKFKLSINDKILDDNNNNLTETQKNMHTTGDHFLNKNESESKNLFQSNISKIIREQEISGNLPAISEKKEFYNYSGGSFISKGDNIFNFNNIASNNKQRALDSINNNFDFTKNINSPCNFNQNINNNPGTSSTNDKLNKESKNFKKSKRKSKIQKRIDRKMKRKRNRNLQNNEDIFIQKLDFLLDEVFSCFIKEENDFFLDKGMKSDYAGKKDLNCSTREKVLLSDTIRDIFYSKNNISINSDFLGKGVYTNLPIVKSKIVIELYYRRVQTYEGEIIEFFINDISEVREKETSKVKSVFKNIVIPNMMHEIKLGFSLIGFIIKNVLSKKNKNYEIPNNSTEKINIDKDTKSIRINPLGFEKSEKENSLAKFSLENCEILEGKSIDEKENEYKLSSFNDSAKIQLKNKNNNSNNNFKKKLEAKNSIKILNNVQISSLHNECLKYTLTLNEYFLSIANDFPNYTFNYNLSNSTYDFDFNPEFDNFDLYETMYFVFDFLKTLLILKGLKDSVRPIIELDPNLPQFFCSDEKRLKEILLNLINNSLKYTKKGYIKISAEINIDKEMKEISSINYVKFTIEDSGIGIQEEKLNEILKIFGNTNSLGNIENNSNIKIDSNLLNYNKDFPQFPKNDEKDLQKAKKNTDKKTLIMETSGYGLSFTKQILDKIGKGINCFSTPNEKTIFSFVLDNKILEISNKKYDFMNNRSNDVNFLLSKNKKSPIEALNGLNTIMKLRRPSDTMRTKSFRLQINEPDKNGRISFSNPPKSDDCITKNNKITQRNILFEENDIVNNFFELKEEEIDKRISLKKTFNKLKTKEENNLNENDDDNDINLISKKKRETKYKELIGKKQIINEISSSDEDSFAKKYQQSYNIRFIKKDKEDIKKINEDIENTILQSPREIEKNFQKIGENYFYEDLIPNNDSKYEPFSTVSIEHLLVNKKKVLNEFSNNLNILKKIIFPLIKVIKNQDKKIILIIENERENKIIIKFKIKKIFMKTYPNEKLKVIFIDDSILALLILYMENLILKNKKVISIIFSQDSCIKNNTFIDCFVFYQIFKLNLIKNNMYNFDNFKIGIFSDELTHTKLNNDYKINNTINNQFFNDLQILKINHYGNVNENLKNGQDEDNEFFSPLEDSDTENVIQKYDIDYTKFKKFNNKDLFKFLVY